MSFNTDHQITYPTDYLQSRPGLGDLNEICGTKLYNAIQEFPMSN